MALLGRQDRGPATYLPTPGIGFDPDAGIVKTVDNASALDDAAAEDADISSSGAVQKAVEVKTKTEPPTPRRLCFILYYFIENVPLIGREQRVVRWDRERRRLAHSQ